MNCEEFQKGLCQEREDDESPDLDEELGKHADECTECATYLNDEIERVEHSVGRTEPHSDGEKRLIDRLVRQGWRELKKRIQKAEKQE